MLFQLQLVVFASYRRIILTEQLNCFLPQMRDSISAKNGHLISVSLLYLFSIKPPNIFQCELHKQCSVAVHNIFIPFCSPVFLSMEI